MWSYKATWSKVMWLYVLKQCNKNIQITFASLSKNNTRKEENKKEKLVITKLFELHANTISWRSLQIIRLNSILYWNTQKIKSLFNKKDKVFHYSCVIYIEICSYEVNYIGETVLNVWLQWSEHKNGTDKNSEWVKQLNENDNHEFEWSVLFLAPRFLFYKKFSKPISLRN